MGEDAGLTAAQVTLFEQLMLDVTDEQFAGAFEELAAGVAVPAVGDQATRTYKQT